MTLGLQDRQDNQVQQDRVETKGFKVPQVCQVHQAMLGHQVLPGRRGVLELLGRKVVQEQQVQLEEPVRRAFRELQALQEQKERKVTRDSRANQVGR